jgi:hypothetical protein
MLGVAVAAGLLVMLWAKGGPQPLHEIVIALPAPQTPATAGRGA